MEWHDHFDADGNLTGRTRVERPSPWDDYSRAEAMALVEHGDERCSRCGQANGLIRVPMLDWYVNYGKRRFLVKGYRCMPCMALDMRQRALEKGERDFETPTGVMAPGDGRRLVVVKA